MTENADNHCLMVPPLSFPPFPSYVTGPIAWSIARIHARENCRLNRFMAVRTWKQKRAKLLSPCIGRVVKKKQDVVGSLCAVSSTSLLTSPSVESSETSSAAALVARIYRKHAIIRWKQKHRPHTSKRSRRSRKASKSKALSLNVQDIATETDVLDSVPPCVYCGAKRIAYETPAFCCSLGTVVLPTQELPDTIRDLLFGIDEESKKFKACIRTYNNHLAFTYLGYLGATCDEDYNGIYAFRAQGQIYHYIDDLAGTSERKSNLQFYIFDTEYELANRLATSPHLYEMTLERILTVLELNPYAKFFRSLSTCKDLDDQEIVLYCNPLVDQRIYNMPTASQVGGIVDGQPNQQRSIKVYTHRESSHSIKYYYGCYDPLQYPLMFPYGQLGWHQGILKKDASLTIRKRKRYAFSAQQLLDEEEKALVAETEDPNCVSMREYYAYKLQVRDNDKSCLLHFGRLFQQYVVDMFVKIETQRLDYFKTQQINVRQDFLQGITDAIASGETDCGRVGQRMVLPSTFTGGPRYMRKKYMDAMSLVRKYGKPDLFLTITCNPSWVEIKEFLQPGDSVQDRPDLVVRVFRAKIEELKNLLFKKNIFGQIDAYTYVIEFQKKGLPHAHFLLILKPDYKIYRPEEFDKFVSSELPDPNLHPRLYKLVIKHMLHGPCGASNPKNTCMNKKGFCKDHYPKDFCEETRMTNDAYPSYRRRDTGVRVKVRGSWLDNRWVIPYSPYLLAKFDCHINVEICATIKAVRYIYKCIRKGSETRCQINEITQYRSGRWVCAPESLWRIYGFSMNGMYPPVQPLQCHLENYQPIMFNKNQQLSNVIQNPLANKTMLTEFFEMNKHDQKAQHFSCTYSEFPDHFVWIADQKRWSLRLKGLTVGRIVFVHPIEGERYYLRLLLGRVSCPTSYLDLRTYENIIYPTFQAAALARGLLEQNESQHLCILEASEYNMPYELRRLFATLLVYYTPNDPLKLWLAFEEQLSEDIAKQESLCKVRTRQCVLGMINNFLKGMGKSLDIYGILYSESPVLDQNDMTKEMVAELSLPISETDLNSKNSLNAQQKACFELITERIYSNKGQAFFIDGPGGTGKTFLYRALLADVRSHGYIALATATSGIAASLLPGGRTAHSRFKIPIDLETGKTCRVSKQTSLAHMIHEAKLIIWDEAPMSKRCAIEALDDLLKDLMDSKKPFGGKVVVLGGDFRQTLPVVRKCTGKETINASLVNSHLWPQLTRLTLTENMRALLDPAFTSFLLSIGEGRTQENDIESVSLPANIILESDDTDHDLERLIDIVFPELQTNNATNIHAANRVILSTKNDIIDEINESIIQKYQGVAVEYTAFDETANPDDQGIYENMLNSLAPNGLPPYKLTLKKSCPIILLRNIDPTEGLCNGTRLICKELGKNIIQAEIATGDFIGKNVFIHRIPLQPSSEDEDCSPVQFKRVQFPIKLSFAMTINKSQGQTLDFVGVYLKEPVFSHGQLYVALSRAKSSACVKVLLHSPYSQTEAKNMTRNVVYPML